MQGEVAKSGSEARGLPNHVLAMVAPKFSMCRYFTGTQFHPVGDLPKMGSSSFVTTLTAGFMVDISTLGFVHMYVHCNWTNLELRGPTLWYVPRFAMDNCLWKHTVFFSRYSQPIFPLFSVEIIAIGDPILECFGYIYIHINIQYIHIYIGCIGCTFIYIWYLVFIYIYVYIKYILYTYLYIYIYIVCIYIHIQNILDRYTTCHAFDTSTWSPDPDSEEAEAFFTRSRRAATWSFVV